MQGASPEPPAAGTRGDLPGRIVLVGFMGAGKTTVGRLLARRLGYDFVDLDEEVERLAGRTIPEIFRSEGEAAFRALEAEVTSRLDDRCRIVIAAGGGWMARPELRDRWTAAVRVWLQVSEQNVLERLGSHLETRPLLGREPPQRAIRTFLEGRRASYRLAELRVDTDGRTAVEVAECVLELLARAGT